MRIVSVPYTVQGKELYMATLKWPQRCACCGIPSPGTTQTLTHSARHRLETVSINTPGTSQITYYPLSWSVPWCGECAAHSGKLPNLTSPLAIVAFLVWAGLGYLLFLMGLAYNTLAVLLYVVILIVFGFGVYLFNRWYGTYQARRMRGLMKPECSHVTFPLSVTSDMAYITFKFHNDGYAEEFAILNGQTFFDQA